MAEDTIKRMCLIEEVRCSIFLIQEGLISLNQLTGSNDFYHLPLLLLASGFERLLKMIICLGNLEKYGKFPIKNKYFKGIAGHNIEKLLELVMDSVKTWNYSYKYLATKDDIDFIKENSDLKEFIELLSSFGMESRYYNINIILGSTSNKLHNPKKMFDKFCFKIIKRNQNWIDKIQYPQIDETIKEFNKYLTYLIQRLARALCRMFKSGKLGELGKSLTGINSSFLYLSDDDLYNINQDWFKK